MKRLLGTSIAIVIAVSSTAWASFTPAPALDVDPPALLALPTTWKGDLEPLTLDVKAIDGSGVSRVRAWVMGEHDADYWEVELDPVPGGRWRAVLPAWKARGGVLTYWVEAWDRLGNGPRRAGSSTRPIVAQLDPPPPDPVVTHAGTGSSLALLLLFAPLVLVWVMYVQDRRERA